jgi:DNA-binding CsgD family transcriptional regulator
MEGAASPKLTPALADGAPQRRRRAPSRDGRLTLLLAGIGIQLVAALFFLVDVAMDWSEEGAGGTDLLHNGVELIAAAGLLLGMVVLGLELRRLLVRQARMADTIRVASGAFHDLLEQHFDAWGLTPSERDVALLLVKGLSLAEIAGLRNSAEGTVKAHCNKVYAKAGVAGRTQLVSLFLEDIMDGGIAAR